MTDEGSSDWFKENIPEKGLPENATFTKQFLLDAWHNGYACGCIEAKEELKSLEKENAELKKRNGELAGQKASLERWFGEATKIIKGLLELGSIGDGDYTYVRDAEQFLEEVKE